MVCRFGVFDPQCHVANAVAIHARAQDDTHYASQAHAGAAVIPAALATAEREGASGATLLAGIIAGYEVTATVGEQLAGRAIARGFRASGVFGVLGAAAAVVFVEGVIGVELISSSQNLFRRHKI